MKPRSTLGILLVLVTAVQAADETPPWAQVESWGYQLQDPDPAKLATSPFRLLVIDYSRDGTDDGVLTRGQITALRNSLPGGRRLVAYLSIGEAEDYRYYWKPEWKTRPPPWLDAENPGWAGNYKVKYWHPGWQAILFGSRGAYLDKILDAGFDGIYLDIIDAYEYYEERGVSDARQRMKQLVADLAAYGRSRSGDADFGVFPQNGDPLLVDPEYVATISGIGREETYFGHHGEDEAPTPGPEMRAIEENLSRARGAGKLVLTIDYTTNASRMRKAHQRANNRGFVEYCGVRALDRLVPQPR